MAVSEKALKIAISKATGVSNSKDDMDDDLTTEPWAFQTAPPRPPTNNRDPRAYTPRTIPNPPVPPINPFGSLFDLTSGPLFSTCSLNEAACSAGNNMEEDNHSAQVDKLMNEINNLRTQVVDSAVIMKKLYKRLKKVKEDLNQAMTGSSLRLKRIQQLEKQREALFAYYNGMLKTPIHSTSQEQEALGRLKTYRQVKYLCEFAAEKQQGHILHALEQEGPLEDPQVGEEERVGEGSSGNEMLSDAGWEEESLNTLLESIQKILNPNIVSDSFPDIESIQSDNEQMASDHQTIVEEDDLAQKWKEDVKRGYRQINLDNVEDVKFLLVNANGGEYHGLDIHQVKAKFEEKMKRDFDHEKSSVSRLMDPAKEEEDVKKLSKLDQESGEELNYVEYECLGFFVDKPELNKRWGLVVPKHFPKSPEQPYTSTEPMLVIKNLSSSDVQCEVPGQLNADKEVHVRSGMSSDEDTSPLSRKNQKNCCCFS